MSCPSLPFLSAVFVPNVLARRTSLSPGCGKHIYVLFWFFPFHFAVIHHSTATKAENKVPIRLEAMGPFVGKVTPCGHIRELQLQLKKKKTHQTHKEGQLTFYTIQLVPTKDLACNYQLVLTERMSPVQNTSMARTPPNKPQRTPATGIWAISQAWEVS